MPKSPGAYKSTSCATHPIKLFFIEKYGLWPNPTSCGHYLYEASIQPAITKR